MTLLWRTNVMRNMLTDDIDDLVVEIKRDKGNRQ